MMIDFHAHVLPGMDHGCASTETCAAQLKAARDAGVDVVAATSHFYPHEENPKSYLKRRAESLPLMESVCPQGLTVIPGAEVLVCEGMERMEGLRELATGGALLLEMPFTPWKTRLYDTVAAINSMSGVRCVLAHVDRYDPHDIETLFGLGLLGQLNADALRRFAGRRRLLRWVTEGHITALGSDIHGGDSGYHSFRRACSILDEQCDDLMRDAGELLLRDIAARK